MTATHMLPSALDVQHLALIRANVAALLRAGALTHDRAGTRVLDVAPQDYAGAAAFFRQSVVETLDIDPSAGATYTADLCADNSGLIDGGRFDVICCTEVLEHTLAPWKAVNEIARLLKPGGTLLASAPFNFRVHGPLPDCWRFTEHGWRALLSSRFERITVTALETPERPLMPVHYTVCAIRGTT